MKLRVKFSKHGALKFIGHLDIMRYFQKAIRRAGIDIAYSSGFSPHQIMSFAAPLGVGIESNGEYMDIEVNSITSSSEFLDALNAQMADGIQILEVCLLPENAGNAMASVAAAKYTIQFRDEYKPEFINSDFVEKFFSQKEIIVTKQTKKSETTFDMKPFIYECYYDDNSSKISITVNASSSGNIKPALVIKALYDYNNHNCDYHKISFEEFGLLITREETYINIGTDDNILLKPLSSIGSDY